MNRIVLLGNGFDLAHGLNTRYSDFIEHLCETICVELREKWNGDTFQDKYNFVALTTVLQNMDTISIKDFFFRKKHWNSDSNVSNKDLLNLIFDSKNNISNVIKDPHFQIQYDIQCNMPNRFLNLILKGNNRWADIEQLYYDELLKAKDNELEVNKLNQNFEIVKQALHDYLGSLSLPPKNKAIEKIIYSPILFRDVKQDKLQAYREEIESIYTTKLSEEAKTHLERSRLWYPDKGMPFSDYFVKYLEKHTTIDDDIEEFLLPDNLYMLSFNYTNSEYLYKQSIQNHYKKSWLESQINHIHGELNNLDNPIIFGYGDEYDNNYEQLEKSRVKGVLDNIKSMKYLETTNYRNFEMFINSAPYQVIILGHSCALSDNTLLKTLFEHDNCVSIKPYYYYEEVRENGKWDNYHEIIQALSRCFTDKSKLRSIVVNKEWCSLLPQNQ